MNTFRAGPRPLIQSFANLAASAIAGLLWTTVSARAAFLYLAACILIALGGVTFAARPESA